VDTIRLLGKRTTREYLEKRSGERNADIRIKVSLQLEEEEEEEEADDDDDEAAAQDSWMETSGLWRMFHRERQGMSQVKSRDNGADVSSGNIRVL